MLFRSTALSDHILKPVINWLLALIFGKNSLTEIYTFLKPAYVDGQIDLANSIYIDWGAFINAIINFLIIAFVLFCIVKGLNSLANARANLVGGVATDERKAVAAYRRQGMTKAQAKAKYAEDVANPIRHLLTCSIFTFGKFIRVFLFWLIHSVF